jgi:hypothetical protein
MRAFVYAVDAATGITISDGILSPDYPSLECFQRDFVERLAPGTYRIYVHEPYVRGRSAPGHVYRTTVA